MYVVPILLLSPYYLPIKNFSKIVCIFSIILNMVFMRLPNINDIIYGVLYVCM